MARPSTRSAEILDVSRIPSPWREVLNRELGKLKRREDVLAVGIAGSLAYGDIWPGTDIDIEVILRGDSPKKIVNTEQEVSVDYGYFGETHLAEIPYDTRPVFDPSGVLSRELGSRKMDEIIDGEIKDAVDRSRNLIGRANKALEADPYSALVLMQLITFRLPISFTLAAGENRTIRRAVSRLEKATIKTGRGAFLEGVGTLLSFSTTLGIADVLLSELEKGYRDIWGYFKHKPEGPGYMQQQPDSKAWFKNRIKPLYLYDKRDLVWLVLQEFPFVLSYCFRLAGHERTPIEVFSEAQKFEGPPRLWAARYRRVLEVYDTKRVSSLIDLADALVDEVEDLSKERLWSRK